jgi:RecJ-like exonuclease
MINQIRKWVPVIGLILFFTVATHAGEVRIQSIIRNPAQFDGKSVTISGTATAVNETISHSGNAYSTFEVQDADAAITIKVFTWGHPGTKAGDLVQVTGVFQQVKRVRQYTFYNEVEAQSVTPIAR